MVCITTWSTRKPQQKTSPLTPFILSFSRPVIQYNLSSVHRPLASLFRTISEPRGGVAVHGQPLWIEATSLGSVGAYEALRAPQCSCSLVVVTGRRSNAVSSCVPVYVSEPARGRAHTCLPRLCLALNSGFRDRGQLSQSSLCTQSSTCRAG